MATSEASGLSWMDLAWSLPQAPKPASAKRTGFMAVTVERWERREDQGNYTRMHEG